MNHIENTIAVKYENFKERINIMTIKFIKDVVFKDQKEDSVKIKKGKILTAKVVRNEDGKEEYEITHRKNTFMIPSSMKDVVFEIL
jgi:hypothetical protein|nr:MAG TPA: hypothetical protein [Caudoviricetes sp.]